MIRKSDSYSLDRARTENGIEMCNAGSQREPVPTARIRARTRQGTSSAITMVGTRSRAIRGRTSDG